MKTIFKVGQEVYDQIFFPNMKGIVNEIDLNDKYPITVYFGIQEYSGFYSLDGTERDGFKPTLSTKPYEVEFKGFEQKDSVPTFEEAWKSTKKIYVQKIGNYAKYEGYTSQEMFNAFEALRKLIFLRDYYNAGWQPDWNKSETEKYCIVVHRGYLSVTNYDTLSCVMSFKSCKIRDKFLEEQRELLEIAKPLL